MARIALIACSKTKAKDRCIAREMYWPSALFRGAVRVAEAAGQEIYILSAKYGVLWPTMVIDPYDVTLSGTTRAERECWTAAVLRQLENHGIPRPGDVLVSYLGAAYGEILLEVLRREGVVIEEPLKGMGQGKRLAWFKQQLAVREVA